SRWRRRGRASSTPRAPAARSWPTRRKKATNFRQASSTKMTRKKRKTKTPKSSDGAYSPRLRTSQLAPASSESPCLEYVDGGRDRYGVLALAGSRRSARSDGGPRDGGPVGGVSVPLPCVVPGGAAWPLGVRGRVGPGPGLGAPG